MNDVTETIVAIESAEPAPRISDIAKKRDSRGASTREPELIERRKRRRMDLRSMDGTEREHMRVIRETAIGDMSPMKGDILSRMLRRHSEMIRGRQEIEVATEMNGRLQRLEAGQPAIGYGQQLGGGDGGA